MKHWFLVKKLVHFYLEVLHSRLNYSCYRKIALQIFRDVTVSDDVCPGVRKLRAALKTQLFAEEFEIMIRLIKESHAVLSLNFNCGNTGAFANSWALMKSGVDH